MGVPPAHLSARIHAAVQRALDEQRLVGAVVLVARDGELIHQQATGLADRESEHPMTVDAIFRLASMSKPIVSSVVAFTSTLYEGISGRFVTNLRDAVYGAPEAGR